jgi:hypothetical protein
MTGWLEWRRRDKRMTGLLRVAAYACATVVLLLTGVVADRAQVQDKPAAQPQAETELNTVLMESTFRIEGQNAQNQTTMGTVFIMGRPFPNEAGNLSGHLKSGQRWSLQNRPTDVARDAMVLR